MKALLKRLPLFILTLVFSVTAGCGYLGHLAGLRPDPDLLALQRRTAMLEARQKAAQDMSARIRRHDPLTNAPLAMLLSERALSEAVQALKNYTDTLRDGTSYVVREAHLELANGSAIVSLDMHCEQPANDLTADISTDCLLGFEKDSAALRLTFTPFNITPVVRVDTWVPGADSYAENIAREQIANIGNTLPPVRIPLKVEYTFEWPGTRAQYHGVPNLDVRIPRLAIDVALRLGDVYIFDHAAFVTVNAFEVRR